MTENINFIISEKLSILVKKYTEINLKVKVVLLSKKSSHFCARK